MGNLLSFLIHKKSRRAGRAPIGPAPEPAAPVPPVPAGSPAPSHSAEVVRLEDRRLPGVFPWCPPLPPYIAGLVLGAAISATAAATVTAALSTMPARFVAAAFEPWSA